MFNMLKQFRKVFGPWVLSAPPRLRSRPIFKPMLETLEERWCPAGGGGNTDTLVWNPAAGSQNAAQAANWYDQTQGKQGVMVPAPSNFVVLDGSKPGYNQPIEFAMAMNFQSITVQNGYFNTLKIDQGATITTVQNNIIKTGCTLTVTSADYSGIYLDNNSLNIASGGTLILKDPSGATSGGTFVSRSISGGYINNAGTVTWTGTPGSTKANFLIDYLTAPVLNTGTFNADGGTGGDTTLFAGQLIIEGQDATNTNNVSFCQTSGSLNLKNATAVVATSGYYQSGGSLTSGPTATGQQCELSAGLTSNGDININNGTVVVVNVANTVGTFKFAAATVEIDGVIDVNGQTFSGGNSKLCDVLDCSGAAVTLGADAALDIGVTGGFPLGVGNDWVVMKYGSITHSWGAEPYPTGMTLINDPTQVEVKN